MFWGAFEENYNTLVRKFEDLCKLKFLLGPDAKYIQPDENGWTASMPTNMQDPDEVQMTRTFTSLQEAANWAKLG